MPRPSDPTLRKPRLAIVTDTLPPYRLTVHRRLTESLPDVEVSTLCTLDPSDLGRWPAVSQETLSYLSFGRPGMGSTGGSARQRAVCDWQTAGRIIQHFSVHRPDAVSINGYDIGRVRLLLWCKSQGIPTMLQGDSNLRADRGPFLKMLIKRVVLGTICRCYDAFLPFGSLGRAYFKKYGAPDSRIFHVPLEPDYDAILNLPQATIDAAANRFSLVAGRKRIVYSGRLAPEKRVDLLIKAFAAVAADRPDWDLVIMGDGPLRAELEALVPAAMKQRVAWTGALRETADVFGVYRSCDVLVLPSDYEPWALVLNEATTAGLAIICSDAVGASPELVAEGVNGRTFATGDLQSLIDAMRDVTDGANTERMRKNSPAVVAAWRRDGDPVKGYQQALRSVGVAV